MFFKLKTKKERKGMNLYAIIGGIALAAILGLVVAPRLASAELPGFRSNITSDMNSMQEILQSYAANHQGSYRDLFYDADGFNGPDGDPTTADSTGRNAFLTLVQEGVISGAVSDGVDGAGLSYLPSWAQGSVSIELVDVPTNPGVVNVFVSIGQGVGTVTTPFTEQLEGTVHDFASRKFGNAHGAAINNATVNEIVNNDAVAAVLPEVAGSVADNDGLIMFTIR